MLEDEKKEAATILPLFKVDQKNKLFQIWLI